MKKIINMTPHPITVGTTTFSPCGSIPRVETVETTAADINGLPTVTRRTGNVVGLPEPCDGTFLIVSGMVFDAVPERLDLVCPDTGATAIRDANGRILAVTRLVRRV